MEKTSAKDTWTLDIRAYDPSEDPEHYPITDDYSGFIIKSRDVSKQQSFTKFIAKMTKKLISSGFNVLNLTLPAVMLSNMSSAELILYGFGTVALYTSEAVKETDPVMRMKLVQAGLIANMSCVAMLLEGNPPFPNMLGGTIQVRICPIFRPFC
jgi:hypothetical protein